MPQTKYTSALAPGEKVSAAELESDLKIQAFDRAMRRISRRGFLGSLAGTTAVVLSTGFVDVHKAVAQAASTAPSIPDVLNFALNLEYLEANLYYNVTTGNFISATLNGTSTPPISGAPGKLNLDTPTLALFQALAQDEMNHINDLRMALSTLGATAINCPTINYAPASKGAITTQAQLLATARQFTEVGNGAYQGGAQFLVSNPTVLQTTAQILGAEGQHLGAINYQINVQGIAVAQASSPTAKVDALDVPPSPTQYFSVETATNNGIAAGIPPYRTPQQSLGIVYGVSTASTVTPPTGVTSGGFLPAGANGDIKST